MAALLNLTLEETSDAGIAAQEAWLAGNITIYEFTELFMNNLISIPSFHDDDDFPKHRQLEAILPKIKLLVTSPKHGGTEVKEATNREEFIDLMIKTTWLPFVTGWGILHEGRSMDGGFSRRLHPECEFEVYVPIYWEITKNTFTPAISREDARQYWSTGHVFDEVGIPKNKQPQLLDGQEVCDHASVGESSCSV